MKRSSWKVQTISGQAFLKQFAQVVCPVLNREVHISLCIYQVDDEYDLRNNWVVKTSGLYTTPMANTTECLKVFYSHNYVS